MAMDSRKILIAAAALAAARCAPTARDRALFLPPPSNDPFGDNPFGGPVPAPTEEDDPGGPF